MEVTITKEGITRKERYHSLIPQLTALVQGETDSIANTANIIAALKQCFGFFWIGVYVVKNDELVLGPFQGAVACTRIKKGSGVCGTAWEKEETIIVADVDMFPGHIACSHFSRSEIVVPCFRNGKVIAVLDVDSIILDDFNHIDKEYLEKAAEIIASIL
jgi:L-methionine (R)-S-oxide reductase